jgi:hypothetical protein
MRFEHVVDRFDLPPGGTHSGFDDSCTLNAREG